ncbi:unnamed protein product [Caenorhabditis nigoni]
MAECTYGANKQTDGAFIIQNSSNISMRFRSFELKPALDTVLPFRRPEQFSHGARTIPESWEWTILGLKPRSTMSPKWMVWESLKRRAAIITQFF